MMERGNYGEILNILHNVKFSEAQNMGVITPDEAGYIAHFALNITL